MSANGITTTKLAMLHILSFLQEVDTAAVPVIKEYVEEKIEYSINSNTFYNILYKMKVKNWVESLDGRGVYKLTEVGRDKFCHYEKMLRLKQGAHEEKDNRLPSEKLLSAEEFVKICVNKLRPNKYDLFEKDTKIIYPWSITPKIAECITLLKEISDNFMKIDNILSEIDSEKKAQ